MMVIRFIVSTLLGTLLLVIYWATAAADRPYSVVEHAFRANSTGAFPVPIGRTICLRYFRTIRQIPENSVQRLPFIPCFPAICPAHPEAKSRSVCHRGCRK